ncbi:unnamed protein product, partial [Closterium sp. NIES-53]
LSSGTTALVTPLYYVSAVCTPVSLSFAFLGPCPPSPLTCPAVPSLRRLQCAAPHSSEFPPTTAPLQTLHMDVWGPAPVDGTDQERYFLLVLRERFSRDFPILRLHSDRGSEFSSDLLAELCGDEGIVRSFTLPASPQQNGIAERRIGLIMETSPTLWWTGKAGDVSLFRVWGALSLVRDAKANKVSSRTLRCVFLSFPTDAPRWQFYHQRSRRIFSSQDVTFDEYDSGGVVTGGAATGGAGFGDAAIGGADSRGVAIPSGGRAVGDPAGGPGAGQPPQPDLLEMLSPQAIRAWIVRRGSPAGAGAASPGGTVGAGGTGGAAGAGGGAGAGGAADAGGTRGAAGAGGDGANSPGGTAGAGGADGAAGARGAGAGGTGGAGAAGPRGARTGGAGAAGAGGAVCAGGATRAAGSVGTGGTPGAGGAGAVRAGGTTGAGGAGGATGAARIGGAGGTAGAGGARAGGTGGTGGGGATGAGGAGGATGAAGTGGAGGSSGARGPGAARASGAAGAGGAGDAAGAAGAGGAGAAGVGGAGAAGTALHIPIFYSQPQSSLPPPDSPQLLPGSPVPAPAPHTEEIESLIEHCEPETHASTPVCARCVARPCPPAVPGTHGMALPFALVTELVDFAAMSRLDYVESLVTESESVCPPSDGGGLAFGNDVLEDRQFELECLAADLPRFASMLLCPEGDPDALDIPTPRSYAEAIAGEYSSQWQTDMDGEMASWKSTSTYRVDFFQTFAPTTKMTTLQVLLHVAAQRDYKLHSLDFSTAFLQGSLHEEVWLRRPPGFTGLFPTGTEWSLRLPIYGLRQAPGEWHDTLRTTRATLGFAPSSAHPSLFLRTDTTLPPFYVLVYVDDLVFATADTKALALVKAELQERHTCTDLGPSTLRLPVLLATAHSSLYRPLALSSTFGRVGIAEWSTPRACGLPHVPDEVHTA